MTIRIARMSRSWSDRRTRMVGAIRLARHIANEDHIDLLREVSRILDDHLYSQREEELLFKVDSLSASAIHGFIKRTMPLPPSVLASVGSGMWAMHMPMEAHYLEKLERALKRTRYRLLFDGWRPWNMSGTKLLDIMPSKEDMMTPTPDPDYVWRTIGHCCEHLWDLLRREIPRTGPDQVLCYVPGVLAP